MQTGDFIFSSYNVYKGWKLKFSSRNQWVRVNYFRGLELTVGIANKDSISLTKIQNTMEFLCEVSWCCFYLQMEDFKFKIGVGT